MNAFLEYSDMKKLWAVSLLFLNASVSAQAPSFAMMTGGLYASATHKTSHAPAETVRELTPNAGRLPPDIAAQAKALSGSNQRIALALIEKGEVVFKYRADTVTDTTLIPSFSMAKSLTSTMLGYALCDGKIKDLNDKVAQYVPELSETAYGKSSIKNILQMASGANSSGPNGEPHTGFSAQLRDHKISQLESLLKYKDPQTRLFKKVEPGDGFDYKNLDTATLSFVIEKATGQPFHKWYEATLVKNAGLQHPTGWLLDKDQRAIAHAYFFAAQDDWIRLAMHSLDLLKGKAGACMQAYMTKATQDRIRVTSNSQFNEYGYQFWSGIPGLRKDTFWKAGFGGQFIGIEPTTERIVVVSSTDWSTQAFSLLQNWANKN
jgi:CubicO group peptidase (beta-lactamase class C family)